MVRGMEVLLCGSENEATGATVAASIFLGVFVCLIFADGALTAWALGRAVNAPHTPHTTQVMLTPR